MTTMAKPEAQMTEVAHEIESCRKELQELVVSLGLLHDQVLVMSQRLDDLIARYMSGRRSNNKKPSG